MQSRLVLVVPFQQSRSLRTETTSLCFYRLPFLPSVVHLLTQKANVQYLSKNQEKGKPTTNISRTKNLSGDCTLTSQSIEEHPSPEEKMVLLELVRAN